MLSVPGHVHYAACDGGTAVLDLREGRWHMFTGLGEQIWHRAVTYGSTSGLPEQIAIPAGIDPGALRSGVDTFVVELISTGLLLDDTARPAPPRRRFWRKGRR
ncbi:hypothetical protein EF908_34405 [Streptomyces sp. WAC04770]|nr:hypothetical protein [Streptomyces sp. WAC04770]RST17397.1 hypothetical protein EF908_34405 [Streptomyces sp. WAC04770]